MNTDNSKNPILSKNVSSSNGLEPLLRFPEFKEKYTQVKLGSISKRIQRKDADSTAPIMMLSAASGFIMQSEKYSRDNAGQSLSKYTVLNKGELAYNHGASKLKPYGCCFELKETTARIPYVYHCFSIYNQCVSYIAILLNNHKTDKQLKKLISSSVRMDGLLNISYDEYMGINITIPGLREQEKIVEFLSLFDKRIEQQRQLVEALKRYKRGLFSLLFNNKTTNYVLSDLIKFGRAGGTPDSRNPYFYNGNIPFLSIADMTSQGKYLTKTEKHISDLGVKNSAAWIVPPKSLIISMYASYGLVAINDIELTTSQAMFNIITKDSEDIEYLYYYLTYLSFTGYYAKMVSTGTQPNLNAEKIRNIPVYIPNKSEKKFITDLLSNFERREKAEENHLDMLLNVKSALLQQMFA